jgi:hypothetical protein
MGDLSAVNACPQVDAIISKGSVMVSDYRKDGSNVAKAKGKAYRLIHDGTTAVNVVSGTGLNTTTSRHEIEACATIQAVEGRIKALGLKVPDPVQKTIDKLGLIEEKKAASEIDNIKTVDSR